MKLGRIALLIPMLFLFGCKKANNDTYRDNSLDDNDITLSQKNLPLVNHSNDYNLKCNNINAYFYENGNVPLIDLGDFIYSLDGFLTSQAFRHEQYTTEYYDLRYWEYDDIRYSFTTYWATNKIEVNTLSFFRRTYGITNTDYDAHIYLDDEITSGQKPVTFDLGKYHFDILYYKEKILIPFPILNVLFCSYNQMNIIYNGGGFHFFSQNPEQTEMYKIKDSAWNATNCPNDIRTSSTNGLLFTLDHFYGLKEYKNIDSFENYIGQEEINKMLNNDPKVYNEAYRKLLIHDLNDLHTSYIGLSTFNDLYDTINYSSEAYTSQRKKEYNESIQELRGYYNKASNMAQPICYKDNLAFIKFDSFTVGSNADIHDSDDKISSNAWKYDTYYLMKKCMDEIATHSEIDNIIVDVSTNGGGYAIAMYEVIGFMTNNPVEFITQDTLCSKRSIEKYAVDADNDGSYEDDDAYTQYNWHILSSSNSFSAANAITSICKNMGIAKILGEKSGGGMCSVMSCCLMDGTTYNISSNMSIRYLDNDNYLEIESGVDADYAIERKYFYDLTYLANYINNGYKEK